MIGHGDERPTSSRSLKGGSQIVTEESKGVYRLPGLYNKQAH